MSCPSPHSSASHDNRAGGAAVAVPAACPFSATSQTATSEPAPTESTARDAHNEHVDETALCLIPQPPTKWLTGNVSELIPSFPTQSIWRLANIYGDIYQLDLVNERVVVVSSNELARECYDQRRFDKVVSGPLAEVRGLLGDGLFTAATQEKNWGVAHRILMPYFGPLAIRNMFPKMLDMVSQMILRWDRLGPDNDIVASDDFTRLAFDTIAFCGFSYRFNSFYSEDIHPFAQQMADYLIEAGKRANRTSLETHMRIWSAEERRKNRDAMWKLCDGLVAERKRHPQPETKDLLNAMLYGEDPETGETMSDENIRFNMVTFLVAGHETTSGTLSFLFYHLLKNPDIYQKAQDEVDRVLGDDVLQFKQLRQLKYLEACIRETLRFQGPIATNQVCPYEDTVIGGKYLIKKGQTVRINLPGIHHDARVWGKDHDVFRPERLLDGRFEALPECAWKPFGNGKRACIGRGVSEQEMLMAAAMTLQRFQVHMADPAYDLRLKSTLTLKPAGFSIRVTRRPGKDFWSGVPGNSIAFDQAKEHLDKTSCADGSKSTADAGKKQILVLYGSNAGTCKYLAEDMASAAQAHALQANVKTMDAAAGGLPTDQPVIIITPSYEGRPADNAAHFVHKIESAKTGSNVLGGVQHAIFGVGNSDWTATFHRVPKILDGLMPRLGSKPIVTSGYVDVKEDLVGSWEEWRDSVLSALRSENAGSAAAVGASSTQLTVAIEKPQSAVQLAGEEISEGLVLANKHIAGKEVGPAKMHMEIQLPSGMAYEPGDYLVVLPTNPRSVVTRVVNRFQVNPDDVISIKGTRKEFLKFEHPTILAELLYSRVELSTPASKRQVEIILKSINNADEKKQLEVMTASDELFKAEILSKRKSVIDILEDFPSAELSLAAYLDMLKPLAPRQYSISSSPLGSAGNQQHDDTDKTEPRYTASITYDVHEAPAHSGNGRTFQGVCSTYLASHASGSKIRCYVRRTNSGFHLPSDPSVPIVMIGAGTGLAPFRGFIQERAFLTNAEARTQGPAGIDSYNPKEHQQKKEFGPALMYFGCRDADKDYIYREELEQWQEQGVVQMRPTFSRGQGISSTSSSSASSWQYVHERMWDEREELAQLFRNGGKIYVCGSASKLAKSVMECVTNVWMERHPGATREEAMVWLQDTKDRVRYVSDVFD